MSLLTWLLVGGCAGLLASLFVSGRGFGALANLALGVAGAVIGSWGFAALNWRAPTGSIAGVMFLAFVGAVALQMVGRVFRRALNGPQIDD
ncbi:hypothetical protein BH11MYX2_BH11MYX2_37040 [soil metagenome]